MNNKTPILFTLIYILSFSVLANEPYLEKALTQNENTLALQNKKWIHGSEDCKENMDGPIDIFSYDDSSFILRQNKCLSYEAPFIYVLFGTEKVLVLDTGATEKADEFPIYKRILSLINNHQNRIKSKKLDVVVLHTHSHSDHSAGDLQFEGKPHVSLIKPNAKSLKQFIDGIKLTDGKVAINLGDRELIILQTPGHQEEAITIYDPKTKWLLTGDSFYPGYLYVKDWDAYKQSIAKLASFSVNHEVSLILGTHIEKTHRVGEFYPVGTIYQPEESPLALNVDDLLKLNVELKASHEPREIRTNNFVVLPMNALQKTLSNVVSWFTN